jgi:hypothetical protein
VGRFPPCCPASTAPRPISTCKLGLPPVTAPPTLTAGTHLLGPSSPKSSPAQCPRAVAGMFPLAEPSTCQFLLTTVPPLVHLHPGAVMSLLMQRGVWSPLAACTCSCHHCTGQMPVPIARRRGPRAARFANRTIGAKSKPSRSGCSLPFMCLGSVRWHTYACRMATLSPLSISPPCHRRTDKFSPTSVARKSLP